VATSNATLDVSKLVTEQNQLHVSPYKIIGNNVFFSHNKAVKGKVALTLFGAVFYIMKAQAVGLTFEWKKTMYNTLVKKLLSDSTASAAPKILSQRLLVSLLKAKL